MIYVDPETGFEIVYGIVPEISYRDRNKIGVLFICIPLIYTNLLTPNITTQFYLQKKVA